MCSPTVGAAEAASRTIAVSRTPMALPFYVALQQGFFRDEGLDLIVADCLGGQRCMRQVQEGRADFATASDILVSLAAFRDRNWRVLAAFASSQDELRLILRRSSEVNAPKQLVGLRVGVVPATGSQYFFDALLLTHDVDPRAVRQIQIQPEDAARMLAAGQLDAAAVWEPYASQALAAAGPGAGVVPNQSGYRATFTIVATRGQGKGAADDDVRLLRGLDRAIAFIQREPAKAREVLQQRLQLDAAAASRIFAGLQFRLNLDASLIKSLESAGRWAVREGHVISANQPDYPSLVDSEPLRKAKAQAVAIGLKP
ncbi:ABC transporter substrate-binding protein [Roseateles sp. YR242]|uniref:ABC transporter substrate-binding protein n=1 Tax=Roseateles sp. YR242 TaxID=1855305 RepID=UPI0015A61BD3|nr:ABC transporter substrate-binding protein [Roseateles sp. YR242]